MDFNPNATYQWDRDAVIPISGMEFNILLNTIKSIAASRTTSDITIETMMNVGNSYNLLTQKLLEMVENGTATEPERPKAVSVEMVTE